jgi:hypothetical protein
MKKKLKKEQLNQIKDELLSLGFNIDSYGIFLWIDAFKIIYSESIIDVKESITAIRGEIAKHFKTTTMAVDRAMRTSLEPAKKQIKKKYKYPGTITQATFINIIRLKYFD